MKNKRTAVLLVNVGTPDEPTVSAVRRYLFEFLNDRRVIDLPLVFQKMLVNLVIVPFRAPKSTKLYQRLWTPEGSPLMINAVKNKNELQQVLPANFEVFMAMRYRNPDLREVLHQIRDASYDRLVLIPLFPQYASSTTGTVIQFVNREIARWTVIPELQTVNQFYDHPRFIEAFKSRIESYHPEEWDHILFSYHGLPVRQINKVHPSVDCDHCQCVKALPAHGHYCYRAACYETTRQLSRVLSLHEDNYSVSFQSRLSKNWLTPFTDRRIIELAKSGARKILVAAPAFVADCLETTVEIGSDYQQLFKKYGGEKIQLVESLNDHPLWLQTLKELLLPG